MKNRIGTISLALGLTVMAAAGAQTVLNFDDVDTSPGVVSMPAGYGGLNWGGNIGLWGSPQPPYNPQSIPNRVLFNRSGESGVAESDATFIGGPKTFDGAYFTGGAGTAQFNLYSGATLVATSGILNLSSTPTFLASGYSGPVDKVGIVGDRGFFAMDDFTYEPVPEPSTLGLLALGGLAFGPRPRQRPDR
jgi:hypothetical protein